MQSPQPPELPVDIQSQGEIAQQRLGWTLALGTMAIIIFLLFVLSVNLGFVLARGASNLPDIKALENFRPNESTRIFDRNGIMIANIHGDEDRVVMPLSEISPNVPRAVMAIEDNRFYQHNGVDVRGTLRAMLSNFKGDDVQGGSTVTQQLVKNVFLTPERSIGRKVAEALLAIRVEKHYAKDKIMEMYLNQVYFGNQAYGIEKAARRYFRKAARDLSVAEAALLAGLLKAPEGLSPFVFPEAARGRQLAVLEKMEECGFITPEQHAAAVNEQIHLRRETKVSKHPYFVTYVIQELVKLFGEDVVRRGGLKVYTTIDTRIQEAAEKAVLEKVKSLPESTNVKQGALVAMDLDSAEIIAMVGGVDFEKNQFNNATQARRAAGSTFKPIVYLTGFRLGLITPESPISDRPVYFNTGYSVWSPKNWDGRFMGAMNIRRALALSRNTPTVQIGLKVGIDEIIKTAELAGITSPIDRNFSSLLGSSGMAPIEMTTAYATFARGGVRMFSTPFLKIIDASQQEVRLPKPVKEKVFDPEPVSNLVSILVDVVEKGTGRSAMLKDRQVAGKTGTTDEVRDIWFAGFTTDMVATVWLGNTQYIPLRGVFSSDSAQVWHNFSEAFYKINPRPALKFPDPMPMTAKKAKKAAPAGKPEDEDKLPNEVPAPKATPGNTTGHAAPAPPTPMTPPTPPPAPVPGDSNVLIGPPPPPTPER